MNVVAAHELCECLGLCECLAIAPKEKPPASVRAISVRLIINRFGKPPPLHPPSFKFLKDN